MCSKQLPIPGLELKGYDLVSPYKRRVRRPGEGWPADQASELEHRVKLLELEVALLTIRMEKEG